MARNVFSIPVGPRVQLRVIAADADPADPLGTVVIATGRMEFCEKYDDCAAMLQAMGYDTVVFDWRGQGLSSRSLPNRHKGYVESFDDYIDDLEKIVAWARDRYGDRPVHGLAHSMGGHIVLRAMARRPDLFRAAILSAPMVDIARGRLQSVAMGQASTVAVRCGLATHYVPRTGDYGARDRAFKDNVVTHDPARFAFQCDAIAANPDLALGGPTWTWLRAALTSIRNLREEAAAGRITTKILLASAGDDRVVNSQAQIDMMPRLPNADLISIPDSFHEILQETPPIRARFWESAKAFLARVTAGGD